MATKIPVRHSDAEFSPKKHGRTIDLSGCLLKPSETKTVQFKRERTPESEGDGEFPNARNLEQMDPSDIWNGLPFNAGFESKVGTAEEPIERTANTPEELRMTPIEVASPVLSNEKTRQERLERERQTKKDDREWKYFILDILLALFRRFVLVSAETYQRFERRLYAMKRNAFYDEV